jgi:uncharacterized membrane protein YdjX (TVP38/TMEM64 family)
MAEPATTQPDAYPRRDLKAVSIIKRVILVIVIIGILAIAGRWFGGQIQPLGDWIRTIGIWGPIIFCLIFLFITGVQLPESFLAVTAGVIFGLGEGLAILIFINIVGAIFWFWIARKFLRNWVHRVLGRHPKLEVIEKATANEGFKLMVLLRLGPFSYGALNFILGASDVRFWPYCLALIGMIPGNFATVYFGSIAKHVAKKAADADNNDPHFILLIVGFAMTVLVVSIIAHIAHKALKKAEIVPGSEEDQPAVPAPG